MIILRRLAILASVVISGLCIPGDMSCTTRVASMGGSETGHGMVAGILYEPRGATLAANADVRLRLASALADTSGIVRGDADSGKTDKNGAYSFASVDTGVYVVEGFDSADNRVLIQNVHVASKDSTRTLGPDTLEPAGAIKGQIDLSEGGDPRKVLILSFSINRLARVNTDGSFVFPDLAQGAYTIRILPLLADYDVLDTGGIVVKSSDTTDIGTISPRFTGVPIPKNISLSYDSLLEIVTLSWSKADPGLVKLYNVYRRNIDSNTVLSRINTSPVSDTVFRDSTGVQDMTYEYVVTAVGPTGIEGSQSAAVKVLIKSSFVLLKTIDVTKLSTSIVKAISTPDNRLFVLCRAPTSSLFVLDSNYSVIDTIGAGLFSDPYDMAMDSAGEIFVVDNMTSKVFTLDPKGTLVSQWSVNSSPLVVTIVDSTLVIGTTADVEIFSFAGKYLSSFPVTDQLVKGVARSTDGNLLVYDNSTILKFSISGTPLDSVYNIVLDPLENYNYQGNLIRLKSNSLLFSFDKELYSIDEQGKLIAKANFNGVPTGMFVNENKNTVLVCDQSGHLREYQR